MSSDPVARRLAAAAFVSLLFLPACGKKGDPLPPLRIVPERIDDLAYVQQGDVVALRMSYPATTVAGTTLGGIEAVEVWHISVPVVDPERPPEVLPAEVEARGGVLARLQGAELQSATQGGEIVARLPLAGEGDGELHVYGVRSVAAEGEASELSNLVSVLPAAAPDPPTSLTLEPGGEGIRLRWEAPAGEVAGVHVYRKLAFERAYGDPIAFVAGEGAYVDESARFGERYIYTVTSVVSRQPRRESAFATEREIRYEDRFPPAPPVELVALPETGEVRLVWKPSPSADVAGYLVYRADVTGEYRTLFDDPIAILEHRDTGLASGLTYRYRVTALDAEGNESEPSATAEARPQ